MLEARLLEHEIRVDGGITTTVIPLDEPILHPDDRYPDIISDQRHAYRVTSVAEVEDYWLEYLDRRGCIELLWDNREVVPYINRARWLVDCPNCNAGAYAWDRNVFACCLECGLLVKVVWPAPAIRAQAIRLLVVRPAENQNWHPHKGETVEDLEMENRWLLGMPTVLKDGLSMPAGLRP